MCVACNRSLCGSVRGGVFYVQLVLSPSNNIAPGRLTRSFSPSRSLEMQITKIWDEQLTFVGTLQNITHFHQKLNCLSQILRGH
jgi:hypothetical protein